MKDGNILNRKTYKSIKRYDRIQMEYYLQSIYKQGFLDGRESVPGIDISGIRDILLEINGIGEKRAEQIVEKISNSL